ncbi:Mut7-C RNAse domain-containing protein [Methanospirillum hungatei]|uniref:Mut7-C RNAse domain-containing protein n=1 Tax=Methanospirillum hungatei TaxID=2203 RepID=UPI0026ED8EBF|nr:Mut7-C RNAse domain-containing protein [Methanospirillum hungatei]MCA1916714.1 Mut7-C RNAse domain-containing protein [Methanospirillum hungatei]
MTGDQEHTFFCDRMAGSLCKYLRFMGYDCRSAHELPPGNPREDTDILKIAGEEKRIILTQDAELARRGEGNAIRLVSSDLAAQIRQLVQAGLIHPEIRLTRCSRCNALLQEGTAPEKTNTPVPEDIPLVYCLVCNRQYWEGTHTKNMRDNLLQMMNNK